MGRGNGGGGGRSPNMFSPLFVVQRCGVRPNAFAMSLGDASDDDSVFIAVPANPPTAPTIGDAADAIGPPTSAAAARSGPAYGIAASIGPAALAMRPAIPNAAASPPDAAFTTLES